MKIYPYIAAPALLLAVAACSNDDETVVTPYDANPNAVRIQPTVGGIVVTRTTPADDTQSTQFADGDGIKVSRDGTDFYLYNKVGGTWTPAQGTSYLMWSSATETTMPLQAYYPASASMASFTLPQNQSGEKDENAASEDDPYQIADADYMTFNEEVERGDANTATFVMQRRTARIRVTIDGFGDQYAASSTCSVKIYSPYTTVGVNYSGTEPVVTGTGSALPVTPLNGEGMTTNSTATALVVPSDAAMDSQNFMEVTVNNEATPLYVLGIPAHQAGYSYDYHLTVGKNGIVVNSVLVNPWNAPINVGGGEAEEVKSGPDATTHTITTEKAGQITEEWIDEAVGPGGTSLTVVGPMNENDVVAVRNYVGYSFSRDPITPYFNLDLSQVTELTSIPALTSADMTYVGSNTKWDGLNEIKLPEGLTGIADYAFGCSPVTTVTLPSTLETIGKMAFGNCWTLVNLPPLPSSVTSIGASAFADCWELPSIDLSQTQVSVIGEEMFFNCFALKTVALSNVTEIGNEAFAYCKALTTIDLSLCDALPSLGTDVFNSNTNYKVVVENITVYVSAEVKAGIDAGTDPNLIDWTDAGFPTENFKTKTNE